MWSHQNHHQNLNIRRRPPEPVRGESTPAAGRHYGVSFLLTVETPDLEPNLGSVGPRVGYPSTGVSDIERPARQRFDVWTIVFKRHHFQTFEWQLKLTVFKSVQKAPF